MKKINFIIVFLVLNSFVFSALTDYTGEFSDTSTFLNYDFVPSAVAMGGAFSCATENQNVHQYNPASSAFLESKNNLYLSHSINPDNVFTEYLSYFQKSRVNYGFSFFLRHSYFNGYEGNAEPVGELLLKDFVITTTFSKKIKSGFALGGNVRLVSSSAYIYSTTLLTFDLGTSYKLNDSIMFSLSLNNMGLNLKDFEKIANFADLIKDIKFVADKDVNFSDIDGSNLPTLVKLGTSLKFFEDILTVSCDANFFSGKNPEFKLGSQVNIYKTLIVSAGYSINVVNENAFGLGLSFDLKGKSQFEYAVKQLPMLGLSHHTGISFYF